MMAFHTDRPMTGAEYDAVLVVLNACKCFAGRWLYIRELLPPLSDKGAAALAFFRATRRANFPHELLEVSGIHASMARARPE